MILGDDGKTIHEWVEITHRIPVDARDPEERTKATRRRRRRAPCARAATSKRLRRGLRWWWVLNGWPPLQDARRLRDRATVAEAPRHVCGVDARGRRPPARVGDRPQGSA